jgi:DnaB helicase-like protein
MNSLPFTFTMFPSDSVPAGTRIPATWDIVAQIFCQDPPQPRETPKTGLALWSPATFKGDYRERANVEAVYALGFDVDIVPVPSEADLRAALTGRSCFFHSSSSSTPTAPRWRLLLQLSRSVTGAEYDRLWALVASRFPFGVGAGAKDPSRGWYVPREPAEGDFVGVVLDGAPLDVDAVLASVPAEVPALVVAAPAPRESVAAPAADRRQAAAKLLGESWTPLGNRHAAKLALGGGLARDGWSEDDAAAFGVEVYGHVARLEGRAYDEAHYKVRRDVGASFKSHAAGKTVTGWSTLAGLVDAGIASAARDLLKFGALAEAVAKHDATPASSTAPATSEEPKKRRSASERAARIGGHEVARLKTGLATIDRITRGGLLPRKVAVVGGAPGAGKTALLMQVAFTLLAAGVTVGVLAADEDADGLLIRLGQLHGLSRDALENGEPDARAALVKWCESVPLVLADGDEDGGTIEELSRDVRAAAGTGPSALFVDSIQTARCATPVPKGADVRARVNLTMAALKRAAKVDRHLVCASSEISKAAYRNKDQAEGINALSAFKESGDIEYGVAFAMVLVNRAGASELVDAEVVKNRLGPERPKLLLRLDHQRAGVLEASIQDVKTADPLYFVKCDIRRVIEEAAGCPLSKNQIFDRVGGQRKFVLRAVNEMCGAKELHQDKHGFRFPLPGDPGYVDAA